MAAYSEVKKEPYLLEQESKQLGFMLLLNKRVEKLKDVPGFGEYSKKENNLEFFTHSRKN